MKKLLIVLLVLAIGSGITSALVTVLGLKVSSEVIGDRAAAIAFVLIYVLWGAITYKLLYVSEWHLKDKHKDVIAAAVKAELDKSLTMIDRSMSDVVKSIEDIRRGRTQPAKPALKKIADDLGLKLDR